LLAYKKTALQIHRAALKILRGVQKLRPLQNYLKYKILTFLTSSFVVVEKFQSSLTMSYPDCYRDRFKLSCRLKSFRQKSFATVSKYTFGQDQKKLTQTCSKILLKTTKPLANYIEEFSI